MTRLYARVTAALVGICLAVPGLPAAFALKPATEPLENSTPWRQWIATVVIVLICAGIVFKNAKRTDQN